MGESAKEFKFTETMIQEPDACNLSYENVARPPDADKCELEASIMNTNFKIIRKHIITTITVFFLFHC